MEAKEQMARQNASISNVMFFFGRGTSVAAARSSLRLDDDDGDVYGCDVLTECDLDIAVVYRHSLLFAHVYERGATVGGARSR